MHRIEDEKSRLWQQVFDLVSDAVVGIDANGMPVLHNRVAENLLGYTGEALRHLSLSEVLYHRDGHTALSWTELTSQCSGGATTEICVKDRGAKLWPATLRVAAWTGPLHPGNPVSLLFLQTKPAPPAPPERVRDYLDIVFDNMEEAIFVAPLSPDGVHGNFIEVNEVACKRLGYTRHEFMQMNARTLNPMANLDKVKSFGRQIRREGARIFEAIHEAKDGTQIPVEVVAKTIRIDDKDYVLSTVRDLREHRRVHGQETRLGRLIEYSWEEIYVFASDTLRFIQVNQGALDNLGYSHKEICQLKVTDIKPHISEREFRRMTRPLFDGTQSRMLFETEHMRKDGTLYPVEIRLQLSHSEVPPVFLANVQDITSRKKTEEKLQHMANYDVLTGLPNRGLFFDRLKMALENSQRNETLTALIYLDIDEFKSINDSFGHDTGDALLKQVAKRLSRIARKVDTVARLGGDEFTMILTNLKDVGVVESIALRIIHAIGDVFYCEGHTIRSSTSLGIAFYPFEEEDDVNSLIKQADAAMYHAKKLGKNNFQFYSVDLWKKELERVKLEHALKTGLAQQSFYLVYQPRYELQSMAIVGAEALLRFEHPELGLIQPTEFIPVLEALRLIQEVGRWVLQRACLQLRQWHNAGYPIIMSVNVSARQLEDERFAVSLGEILREHDIAPRYLELEITEGVLVSQGGQTELNLKAVKAMGVRISLDDFGSGYSSLNYLKSFSIDVLKIDKSFITDLDSSADSSVIVDAIIGLANNLKLQVTAEGIETASQLHYLQRSRCQEGQGFYFAKPIAPQQLQQLMAEGREKDKQKTLQLAPAHS